MEDIVWMYKNETNPERKSELYADLYCSVMEDLTIDMAEGMSDGDDLKELITDVGGDFSKVIRFVSTVDTVDLDDTVDDLLILTAHTRTIKSDVLIVYKIDQDDFYEIAELATNKLINTLDTTAYENRHDVKDDANGDVIVEDDIPF